MVKVNKTNELQGWRLANEEELKVVQGILLKGARFEIKSSGIMNFSFVLFLFACISGIKVLIDYISIALRSGNNGDVVILAGMIVVLLLISIVLGINLIKSITKKTEKTYYEAINTNKLRVVDIQIEEVISLRGIGSGIDGHRVRVKDMYDVYCEENIVFECCNGYQKTKGLLIDVPIREDENGVISRKCVIPCKENDPHLWRIGMKNYNELTK